MTIEPARRLPHFIGVGPARTGTTWVHQVMQGHAGLPRRTKETDYFSTNYDLGLAWYLAHFADYPAEITLGEFTPTYFDHPEAPTRIALLRPDCRILVSLRDPVDRLYSHYRLLRVEGWIGRESFEEAIARHSRWAERPGNMLGVNRYALHLRRWFDVMGRRHVLVGFYDDLEQDPQGYIDTITAFIGVPGIDLAGSPIGANRVNLTEHAPRSPYLAARARRLRDALERRSMYRSIEALGAFFAYCAGHGEPFGRLKLETRRVLRERFRPEVEDLEQLVGRDLSRWKE